MRRTLVLLAGLVVLAAACDDPAARTLGPDPALEKTQVPGHQNGRYDTDGNGIPDAGVYVNGHYTSVYAYDGNGDWYWDLGDGRVQGTVESVDDLDATTLTVCDYVVNYRADFGNDPFMDAGWIQNHINCQGFADNGHYNYLIVHESDPRYQGNPDWSIWGTWEYHTYIESGHGNLVRPYTHVGG
jgi:hypothetical protein